MYCAIYKSNKKEQTYLYLQEKDAFHLLPRELAVLFGSPILVMMLDLSKRNKLAQVDIHLVKKELDDKGYFLQLPPVMATSVNN